MKKIFSILLCLTALFSLCACNSKGEYENSRIQMDLNPSIEIVINEDGKVVSVTGLNDDGEILISGEVIVGKDFKVAVDTIVGLSIQMGYVNKEDSKDIEFSVSGDSEYASKVFNEVKAKANETLAKYGIDVVSIKQSVAESIDNVKEQIKAYMPEFDFSKLSEEEIYAKLGEIRNKYKGMSVELINKFKESQAYGQLVNKAKAVADYLENNSVSSILLAGLKTLTGGTDISTYLRNFETKYNELLAKYSESYVERENAYQTAKDALLNKKVELAELKNEIAELDPESHEYAAKLTAITAVEAAITLAESALDLAKAAVDQAIALINAAIAAIKTIVEQLLNGLTAIVNGLEGVIEQAKSYSFEDFAASFNAELSVRETELGTYKAQIIASLDVQPIGSK